MVDFSECVSGSSFVILVKIVQHLGDSISSTIVIECQFLKKRKTVEEVGFKRNEDLIDFVSLGV